MNNNFLYIPDCTHYAEEVNIKTIFNRLKRKLNTIRKKYIAIYQVV